MNNDLLLNLFLNLVGVAFLFMFAKWLFVYAKKWWLRTARMNKVYSDFKNWSFLKIRIPREVNKTPAAMEVVLLAFNQSLGHHPASSIPPFTIFPPKFWKPGSDTKTDKPVGFWAAIKAGRIYFYKKYILGSLRGWSSLEIVSDEGSIYFLVVTRKNNKELFKQAAFAQFPGIEIEELSEDPLNKFHYTGQRSGLSELYVGRYACAEGKDHMPIKTYVDYGLDREMVKDEFKIDPLVGLLEAMAQAKKGEMYWLQIMIRPTIYNPKDFPATDPHHPPYHWVNKTQEEIDNLMSKQTKTLETGEDVSFYTKSLHSLSLTDKHKVEIMQKNLEKPGFDTIIRMFAWVDKKVNPGGLVVPKNVMTIVNAMKAFEKPNYGNLGFDTITTDIDEPFLDPTGNMTDGRRKSFWKKAKLRGGFYLEATDVEFEWNFAISMWKKYKEAWNWDYAKNAVWGDVKEYWLAHDVGTFPQKGADGRANSHGFVMNIEELATLWHFPGKSFGGNAESKVGSVKSDPPSNLPI